MKISLIDGKIIKTLILPEKPNGNFWLTYFDEFDNEKNLINIEAVNDEWVLNSNEDIYCLENNKKVEKITLHISQFYLIKDTIRNVLVMIYCSPVTDGAISYYSCEFEANDNKISIGKAPVNNIIYSVNIISDNHATLELKDNKILIINNDKSTQNNLSGIYINNKRVKDSQYIDNGDIVSICGLKIVLLKKEDKYYIIINNPNNAVRINGLKRVDSFWKKAHTSIEDIDDIRNNVFEETDYFYKNPRFISEIEELEISIDLPPQKQEYQSAPLLLTVGPMITMGMTSAISAFLTFNNVMNYNMSWVQALPSLTMCFAMLASTFLWPSITRLYQKKQTIKAETQRVNEYSNYIAETEKIIADEQLKQSNTLKTANPTIEDCYKTIINKYTPLWERRIDDNDFLKVSVGTGNVPMKINIKFAGNKKQASADELVKAATDLATSPKILTSVPVEYSFIENKITGVVGDITYNDILIKNIILQLIASHGYDDLKIVIFTSIENEAKWDFMKFLPHCWNIDKSLRFFASNNEEYKELCYNLGNIYTKKTSKTNNNLQTDEFTKAKFLIITDSFKAIRNYDFISNLLNEKEYYDFSILVSSKKLTQLPDQCRRFIKLEQTNGEIFGNVKNENKIVFNLDDKTEYDLYKCTNILANTPIEHTISNESKMPNTFGFLEMYDVGKIDQLNILNRWKNNTPILSLKAPVGIGKSEEIINLDLHEKAHGPHGLIAGMTGSGKSEFIISYILSMAINYHPYEVQFIIIDYKGGSLAGAFKNGAANVTLPHLVGTITNLDVNELNRAFASIESELKRRQRLFNDAREKTREGTIDIYKYQKMYRDGLLKEPVSHLFIIVDEFAELKLQQPEFMEQLVSTARIGRSLGVHLILATQKPNGVVDPQIWSNTRFRVCLRVQETEDSNEVIKCPDAAYLKNIGRFYLQVGYNEIFTQGQSAYAGENYYESEKIKKNIDTSITILNNIGQPLKTVMPKSNILQVSKGKELTNILQYLSDLAKQENISCKQLWKNKISNKIYLNDLEEKYSYIKEDYIINPIIGEYDIPEKQDQQLLTLNLSAGGNTLIYGINGSGKEMLLSTLLYSSMTHYSPEEVNYYILEFGSESLKTFNDSPVVGDIVSSNEEEKITNLFRMLNKIMDERKKILSKSRGDFNLYNTQNNNKLKNIIVILNNYDAFQELYEKQVDELNTITRECSKYGIYFVVTISNPNGIRYKLKQNFSQILCLQQNSIDDYAMVLGNVNKIYPAKYQGRGIIRKDGINEFQTATITDEDLNDYISNKCKEYNSKFKTSASKIPMLPNTIKLKDTKNSNPDEIIIGVEKNTLNILKYNYRKNIANMILTYDLESITNFAKLVIKQIESTSQIKPIVLDSEGLKLNNELLQKVDYFDSDYVKPLSSINNFIDQESFINGDAAITIIAFGIERIIRENKNEITKLIESIINKTNKTKKVNIIMFENAKMIKNIEYDDWFKLSVNNSNGIWFGYGISEQYSLRVYNKLDETKDQIDDNYCFVVNNGKATLVKCLDEFDN